MAYLRCDKCGASTNTQGSWDTPITIMFIVLFLNSFSSKMEITGYFKDK